MTSAEGPDENLESHGRDAVSDPEPRLSKLVLESAIEAEFETGRREETIEEAKRSILFRVLRAVAGFTLIGAGIAMLVLPGSGWVVIVIGLTLLPFAWAERTVRIIRRKIPGIPEEGRIPTSTLIFIGASMVVFTALSIIFGDDVTGWTRSLGDPDKIFG